MATTKLPAGLHELTDATFDETVLASPVPYLVDFSAEWCGPCGPMLQVLAEVAREHGDKVRIGKLDVDGQPVVPPRYDVMAMPTMVLFKHGQPVTRLVGARGKARLLQDLADHLDW